MSTETSTPIPPRDDPWYTAPAGFEHERPGAVLRIRTAPGDVLSLFDGCAAIYNILFRTTNSQYQPSWGVTTLFVPTTSDRRALLSNTLPYNSCDVNASPSFIFHQLKPGFPWYIIVPSLNESLRRGWYVSIPDHEGPSAAFGDGITTGHTHIDSIRSVLHAGFGLDQAQTRVALWGYSGGAFAAAWAAELQGHYAPELRIAGAALGGLPIGLSRVLSLASGGPFAGLIPQVLLGITAEFPAAYEVLRSQLKPERRDAFLAAHHYSIGESFATFAGENVMGYFVEGEKILEHPLIQRSLLRRNPLGFHGIPEAPLFFYKAIADELAVIEDTDALVERWGSVGANIVSERNTVGDHLAEMANGVPRALEFLDAVLSGTYVHDGCTTRDVTVSVTE